MLDRVELRLKPLKRVLGEHLTAPGGFCRRSYDQLVLADRDRNVLEYVAEGFSPSSNDRLSFRLSVGLRQKNGSVCLDLGHFFIERGNEPVNSRGFFYWFCVELHNNHPFLREFF